MKPSARSRARLRERLAAEREEPGYAEWHELTFGKCAVCGWRGRLVRHHVFYEQHVRAAGGAPWDLRNSMGLGRWCPCHELHHSGARRIRIEQIPESAREFGAALLGPDRAALYLDRYYDTTRRRGS